jgi:D-lactate dehydrogenase
MVRLQESGRDPELLRSLEEDYQYAGLDTCAVDGLCATACPVGLNTGDLVKRLRAAHSSNGTRFVAAQIVRSFGLVENILRNGVGMGHAVEKIIGASRLEKISLTMERLTRMRVPKWNAAVLHRSPNWTKTEPDNAQVIYFPSCISRSMGIPPLDSDAPSLIDVFVKICQRANIKVHIPEDSHGSCCGMPFSSKGYTDAYREMLHKTLERMWQWSQLGRLPIVIDSSSCAYSLRTSGSYLEGTDLERWNKMTLLDSVEFARDWLIPNLKITPLPENVILHPNCALRKLNLDKALKQVVDACVQSAVVPENLSCCAFAGDRGLLVPELTASATALEAAEVLSKPYDGYYSSNLTCEMGMSLATRKPYCSFLYLIEKASR